MACLSVVSPTLCSGLGKGLDAMAAPGWYPDPNGQPVQCYWDGYRWTGHWVQSPTVSPERARATAGWYSNPADPTSMRYWDGSRWLEPQDRVGPEADPGVARSATEAIGETDPVAAPPAIETIGDGPSRRLDETPAFCRARVTALGSLDTTAVDEALLGAVITPWTDLRQSSDIFAEVYVRGVLIADSQIHWLSGDARVQIIEPPRYADLPEDLISKAPPMKTPSGVSGGTMPGLSFDTPEGWPPLIWDSNTLFSAVRGWSDPQNSVEIILCALAVAPHDGDVQPTLLAGLKARYARVTQDPRTYPPARYPWRRLGKPDIDGILSL